MVKTGEITLTTRGYGHMQDITDPVAGHVAKSGIKNGMVTVFVPGATGGITTIEYEPGLVQDFDEMMEKIAPKSANYHHNERWHDGNGFSHLRASLLGCHITIPFVEGRLTLGTWQQVVFIDFDNKGRSRRLVCQVMGE